MNAIKFENEIDLQFIIVLGETALQNYTENEKTSFILMDEGCFLHN